ncbi:helix-turn-helix domain-containing protein [Clostridium paridis]|uniref:Helix-turn-helix transcriptional regulator n=1 Tax=Clostridium paridis TaxID=2803863 RepID=A0A937K3D3_9CLOT|nr:helix-turn-helix transcriptional regulator [Clostridium paridis]MBL4932291.1 helix-turn-helix transcriptional regulator [Clostridium paridis]
MLEKLKEIRIEKRVSGHTLSKILGFKSPSAYYKKEKGITPMTISEAEIIAKYLGIKTEIFFNEEVSL